jgi:hypothetical protein
MIIGLVGFIGSGKDTVANLFLEKNGIKDSFAAPLKDVLSAVFGWPRHLMEGDSVESRDFRNTPDMFWSRKLGIANFTPRLAMQLVGTDTMREHFHKDIWINSLEYRMRCVQHDLRTIVISDARFQNELDLIRRLNGHVIWVQRGELPEWYDTAVEANNGNAVSKRIMQTRYSDIHQSEWDWVGYNVDHVIENNDSIESLNEKVNEIYKTLGGQALRLV